MMVSVARVLETLRKLVHVRYLFGAKAGDRPLNKITELDCSGFVQVVLREAGLRDIPAGSVLQHRNVEKRGWRKVDYEDLRHTVEDGARLFIMFIDPDEHRPGHVALVNAGKTIECCSSKGVCRRRWNIPSLATRNPSVYEIPTVEAARRHGTDH